MQNAGQQYCQGGATSHQNQAANFGPAESSNTSNGGSTTSSLRQFRRKIEDKHQSQDTNSRQIPESHVARVAPQNHYPPRTSECYRYPNQYQDYSYNVPSQVKYSEISEPPQSIHQEHISPASVIQKAKGNKEYMEICNPPHVVKQPYSDIHMNNQQQAYNDGTVVPQNQYIPKDTQVHPLYKPESQYFPKEPQYPAQLQHQMQKYNMPPTQMRKFPPSENEFLSKLQQINPMVARSIMSDHHLQEPQKTYQNMDQSRMYPLHHNQRYMNHPPALQGNHYSHAGYMPPQPYSNYPSSCTFARTPQINQPRFPAMSPHERSMSPRRSFSDGMTMSINYPGISQKMSPNYPQYNSANFAQHYQQRRSSITQDYYQQHYRPAQYLPHQMPAQDIPESRVTVSDSIKQYIENWADEETASEMNQIDANRFNKDGLRVRDDQLSETVYTINASELQYLEPLVESESGIPLVTSVSIDNTSGMIRIVDKNGQVDFGDQNGERIVNVHIMEPTVKSDCMLASNKPNEGNQRLNNDFQYNSADKNRVVIHQNTVIQSSSSQNHALTKDQDQTGNNTQQTKVGSSLPIITDERDSIEELEKTIIKDCRKEGIQTVDKNCSPINMEEIRALKEDRDFPLNTLPEFQHTQNSVKPEIFKSNPSNIPTNEMSNDEKSKESDEKNDEETYFENKEKTTKDVIKETELSQSYENLKKEYHDSNNSLKNDEKGESKTLEDAKEIVENIEENQTKDKNSDNSITNNDAEKIKENIHELVNEIVEKCDKNVDGVKTKEKTQIKEKNCKRSKRIFSVDDIINNIGHNMRKCKKDNERRHSLHSVMEFLGKEVNNTFVYDVKEKAKQETVHKIRDDSKKNTVSVKIEEEILFNVNKGTGTNMIEDVEITKDEQKLCDIKKQEVCAIKPTDSVATKFCDEAKTDQSTEKILIKPPCSYENLEASQEMQFRNVIKVEESNVLLHIAGEFVEINVANVNGKKVITVTPMTSSTLVDFNDNYEPLDSNDIPELLKFGEPEIQNEESQVLEIENVVPEPDCVEPSTEIIIGMDLTLEEEIKLDVEQPQIFFTKAAKKSYDNDLQIPSITTSEDINNKSENYNSNDKVTSSKEKNFKDTSEELDDIKSTKSVREKLREFRKIKRPLKAEEDDDEDEFVPFKELIKARKIKKMKMLELKKIEEVVTADSTNKDDIIKETNNDSKSSKNDEKKLIKSAEDETKASKILTGSKNRSRKSLPQKRNKEKRRRSEEKRSVKQKSRTENKNTMVEKACTEQDVTIGIGSSKSEGTSSSQLPKESMKEPKKVVVSEENQVSSGVTEIKENVAELREKEQLQVTVDKCEEKTMPPNKIPLEKPKIIEEAGASKTSLLDQQEVSKEPENSVGKKKLSLQEYNNRKRKLLDKNESSLKKISLSDGLKTLSASRSQRPKSLDDLECLKDPKPFNALPKRKYSLGSLPAPNTLDWEETQSPKSHLDIQEKRFSEFRGLISEKTNPKPVINQVEDKSLQNYKEKVESKLSSLNIQIPKSSKNVNVEDGVLKSESSGLMQRFLKNDKLTPAEMEQIRNIISYKRLIQQLNRVKPQDVNKNSENKNDPSSVDKDVKFQLKKEPTVIKKKRRRFRNLYGVSSSDSEEETIETKNSSSGDYSVVQSNCLAGVVPKLIIKRKPEMPLPFVKLERLDLNVLIHEKRVCIE